MKMIKIPLSQYCTVIVGKDKPTNFSEEKDEIHNIPVCANGIENDGIVGYTDKALIQQEAVTISARGNVGLYVDIGTDGFFKNLSILYED